MASAKEKLEKLSKGLAGIAGEYFVAAELSRRGFMASVTLRNNDSIDIHASKLSTKKLFAIQVKTAQRVTHSWPLSKKAERLKAPNIFYIFVSFRKLDERPDYYIVPSTKASNYVKRRHKKWLDTPGKKGQKHNDTNMRVFEDKKEKFKERWDLIA